MAARIEWLPLPAVLMSAPCAFAAQYFSLEQVQHALFADATEFRPRDVTLSAAQVAAISKAADAHVLSPTLRVWEARNGALALGYLVVDQVYGKHEFITYAVALSLDGKVSGIEVMSYNESYGDQIRAAAWRAQFYGKQAGDTLKVKNDIRNIGGATLSCVHLTEGVRRVLVTYQIAIKTGG